MAHGFGFQVARHPSLVTSLKEAIEETEIFGKLSGNSVCSYSNSTEFVWKLVSSVARGRRSHMFAIQDPALMNVW